MAPGDLLVNKEMMAYKDFQVKEGREEFRVKRAMTVYRESQAKKETLENRESLVKEVRED